MVSEVVKSGNIDEHKKDPTVSGIYEDLAKRNVDAHDEHNAVVLPGHTVSFSRNVKCFLSEISRQTFKRWECYAINIKSTLSVSIFGTSVLKPTCCSSRTKLKYHSLSAIDLKHTRPHQTDINTNRKMIPL